MGTDLRKEILGMLETKSLTKAQVNSIIHDEFQEMKNTLHEMSGEINESLDDDERTIKIEYRDKGTFVAQLQVADDILIFNMHTDVFCFDPKNEIWKNEHILKNSYNGYFGIINIYNFLSDTFKYTRTEDEGYLIARIFVNREKMFFVEGEGLDEFGVSAFGKRALTEEIMINIIEKVIVKTIGFDLYVPPFSMIQRVNASQVNTKIENSKIETGKRFGFEL
ncbi:MAG: hypothetical protein RSB93_02925 [Rikenellaceae bacterium]